MFTAALAVAFGLERPSLRTAVEASRWQSRASCALTGLGSLDVGALAIAANCFSYSLYIVFSKRVLERVGALTLVTWIFTWGALIFAPVGGARLVAGAAVWGARSWVLVGVIVAIPTIVAYSMNAWALRRSTPTVVTVYIYLQPLFTALLQWAQLGEPVTARALVAAALILAGMLVVATRRQVAAGAAAEVTA